MGNRARWTVEHDNLLRELWLTATTDVIGKRLGFHPNSVSLRAKSLGLPKKSMGPKPGPRKLAARVDWDSIKERRELDDFCPMVGSDRLLAALQREHAS